MFAQERENQNRVQFVPEKHKYKDKREVQAFYAPLITIKRVIRLWERVLADEIGDHRGRLNVVNEAPFLECQCSRHHCP